jgi:hypothetical protein
VNAVRLGWAPTTDEWQAFGAVGTLVVAVVAAIYAGQQVREARRSRDEQTRPYVAVYLEVLREVEMSMLQLVFKNFGTTTARDITVTVDQPMRRAWGRASSPEELKLFDRLPALVPGQTWETLFDWGPDRFKAGLNEVYKITVHSHDSSGKKLPDETFVIDWNTLVPTRNVGVKTTHHVGKSLSAIERTMQQWTEGLSGLRVFTRSGEEKDRADLEWYEQRVAKPEADAPNWQAEDDDQARPSVVEQVNEITENWVVSQQAGQEGNLSPTAEPDPDGTGNP